MHRMQNVHRVNRVQYIANLKQSISSMQQRIRELEAQLERQELALNGLRDDYQTAQLLIAHYKADEEEAAEMERRGTNRLMRDRQRTDEEIDALTQGNEGLRVRLVDETKKYERMLRDRNASMKNLAETEKGAKRQVEELAARDATITQLRDQIDKITADSIKKSTKIEDLRGDSSKKSAKVDDLRSQRTGLRNRLDEQAALHQAAVEEKDSEMASMRELINVGTEDLTTLQATTDQIREERERLQLRYNELGLSLVTTQEELEEARTLAGANAVATANMARQIEVLVEDQILRRQELDGLRRQLEASTTSALDAQSRLQSYSDRTGRTTLTPAGPVGNPLTRATATPSSGVTTQPLPDPFSYMYAGSGGRGHRSRGSRDRDDESED